MVILLQYCKYLMKNFIFFLYYEIGFSTGNCAVVNFTFMIMEIGHFLRFYNQLTFESESNKCHLH